MSEIMISTVDGQNLVELIRNDTHSIVIAVERGYEPIVQCRDILMEKCHFCLESEYGITDMTYIFSFEGISYRLHYNSDEDMITFEMESGEESVLYSFRKTAAFLHCVFGGQLV